MQTKTVNAKTNPSKAIEMAVKCLKKGKILIVPTETSYGLAIIASDKNTAKKIAKIKKQPENKHVSIIVPDLKTAKKYGHLNALAKKLVQKFMPGPLTLVVPAKKKAIHLGKKTIAFRISSNKITQAICKKLEDAITATSANLHGQPDTYSAKKAMRIFNGKVSLIVNAGNLPKRLPSTIFDVQEKKILRKGKITEKQIKKFLQQKKTNERSETKNALLRH